MVFATANRSDLYALDDASHTPTQLHTHCAHAIASSTSFNMHRYPMIVR